ncbi:FeoA family protein [Blautia obeum]|uniref:FeoA family protein n=1 Tax=Blautia obeum TaxID=40520 RepID=UPI00319D9B72
MQALSQTNTGDTCTIKWMFGVPEILETMRKMDIKEGSTIQVIQKCRDWLIIGSNNRRLAVGNEVADRIQV